MTPIARLVHSFGTKLALDVRKPTHEGGKTRVLCLLLGCLADESISEREKSHAVIYVLLR